LLLVVLAARLAPLGQRQGPLERLTHLDQAFFVQVVDALGALGGEVDGLVCHGGVTQALMSTHNPLREMPGSRLASSASRSSSPSSSAFLLTRSRSRCSRCCRLRRSCSSRRRRAVSSGLRLSRLTAFSLPASWVGTTGGMSGLGLGGSCWLVTAI